MMYQTLKPHWYELCIVYIYLFNFNSESYIALQFYIKTSKVIVIVIITFLQVL